MPWPASERYRMSPIGRDPKGHRAQHQPQQKAACNFSLFFSSFQTENYSFDSNYVNSRAHLIKRYVGWLESSLVCPAKSWLFNVLSHCVICYLLFLICKTFPELSFDFKNSIYCLLSPIALGLQQRKIFFLLFGSYTLGSYSKLGRVPLPWQL